MTGWRAKAEGGSASLIALVVWLARVAGRRFGRALLYPIVLYFVVRDGVARRASLEFLATVQGRTATWREMFSHLYYFAATLLDRVYMAAGDFHRFEVNLEGLALVEAALQKGKGCLLLGSHLGSFDLLMLANRAMDGRPVSVMMRVDPRARLRRIAGIKDDGPDFIQIGRPDSYLRAYEALGKGGIVALLADRAEPGAASLDVTFLGRQVALPLAPHVLAARSGAAVLVCFGLYEGRNRYRIRFVEFGEAAASSARGAALRPLVERYAAVLEEHARRYPLNWFNFYSYWTQEPAR